jgi:hypothetical protein
MLFLLQVSQSAKYLAVISIIQAIQVHILYSDRIYAKIIFHGPIQFVFKSEKPRYILLNNFIVKFIEYF